MAMSVDKALKVWLITGANRGIGRAMVDEVARLDNQIIIAAVRSLSKSETELVALNKFLTNGTKIIVVQIDSFQLDSAAIAASTLEKQGITHIDVLVANAGIASSFQPVSATSPKVALEHFRVNALGTLSLFQAFEPLLRKSNQSGGPKFVYISTAAASFANPFPMPGTAYVPSKLAGNYYVTRLHEENSWLTSFSLSPGGVLTDMGMFALNEFGMVKPDGNLKEEGLPFQPITAQESGSACIKRILNANRENAGGRFLSHEGDSYMEF